MRYCDIDAPRSRSRTRSVTRWAYRENRTTARPAELPPPTTTIPGTSRRRHSTPPANSTARPRISVPVGQLGGIARPIGRDADQGPGQQQFGTEPARLHHRARRQFAAADAVGKTEIVLDHRRGPG